MNAEELDTARRLVACKGWTWLSGMQTAPADPSQIGGRFRVREAFGVDYEQTGDPPRIQPYGQEFPVVDVGMVPDLSDDLTRLGVIEVMQRAWGAPYSYPEPVESFDSDGVTAGVSWRVRVPGRKFEGDTDVAALLAALEAAP